MRARLRGSGTSAESQRALGAGDICSDLCLRKTIQEACAKEGKEENVKLLVAENTSRPE